jgi:MoxR-like ATPase
MEPPAAAGTKVCGMQVGTAPRHRNPLAPHPLRHRMAKTDARELVESGARPTTAAQRLRTDVLGRLQSARRDGKNKADALATLFPKTILETDTLETLVAGLLSGSHLLMLGPPGSGKTSLAKAVWELMPKDLVAVAGCPVQDDPWSLMDPDHARVVPPCPVCVDRHGGHHRKGPINPADIAIETVHLREGHGFARVQGSPEVFPDNLTGSVNLARLEEIGDPNSPLVLEPGKLLQAHRGLLLVDEVGKLPRGTQNVLLQALQERIVSPAKSRETFPADIVAVTTSNLHDLGNITEPLTDRLANVHVPFPTDPVANRRIVDLGLDGVPVPGPYRDAAVRLVLHWRAQAPGGDDLGEVGSNRTLVDIVRRAWAHAIMSGDRDVDPEDLRRGAFDSMTGRIRARSADGFDENREQVGAFVEANWKAAAKEGASAYWCRFFDDELNSDKAAGARVVKALREAVQKDASAIQALIRKDGGDADVRRFALFVQKEEGVDREGGATALPKVFRALEELGAFG